MAYTVVKKELVALYRDIRGETRRKTIELSDSNLLTDDDANHLNGLSKSTVRSYVERIKQTDMANTPDADSEVDDTARLYFLMEDDTQAWFDIVDPKDDLFVDTEGSNANVLKSRDDLSDLDPTENALKEVIDGIMNGEILISDGETPVLYIGGKRI